MADDGDIKSRSMLGAFGLLLAGAGVGIVSPGFKDALLAALNHNFVLGLYLSAPPWAGALMIFAGAILLILAFLGQTRVERAFVRLFEGRGSSVGSFVAIRHIGFAPTVRELRKDELPAELARRDLGHLTVDLSLELGSSPPALEPALAKQLRMPDQVTALLGVNPDADLGYCGIVQAPFQLLAGHQLASWTRLRTFEWHRHDHRWVPVRPGAGADLGVSTRTDTVNAGADVAIAVEVSYAIDAAEIVSSVPGVRSIVRVALAAPALDSVTHEGQVAELARQFRDALDAARGLAAGACVHVFCAAPMSVGFEMGRMVSRTLHPPVRVYAYDRKAPKPYAWGIEINSAPGMGQLIRN